MELIKWAENEVKIAIEKSLNMAGETAIEDGEYLKRCYLSALKAFKSLAKDDHSGMSIRVTQQILNSLIKCNPLTPIEGTDDDWNPVYEWCGERVSQCRRMSSLFKYISEDGTVRYSDNNRVVCESLEDSNNTYFSKWISDMVDEMYPITMPYTPMSKPYRVVCHDILSDSKNGDFDTVFIYQLTTPEGEHIEINRYFKESEDGWLEIDANEWLDRLYKHIKRRENLEAERQKS